MPLPQQKQPIPFNHPWDVPLIIICNFRSAVCLIKWKYIHKIYVYACIKTCVKWFINKNRCAIWKLVKISQFSKKEKNSNFTIDRNWITRYLFGFGIHSLLFNYTTFIASSTIPSIIFSIWFALIRSRLVYRVRWKR